MSLIRRREAMRALIEQETRKMYNLVKKERYIGGNRPGRFLAKALRMKKTSNYIEKNKNKRQVILDSKIEIAEIFRIMENCTPSIKRTLRRKGGNKKHMRTSKVI